MRERFKGKLFAAWIIIVFLVMALFYVYMHPIYMISPDDWTYASYSRQAWPMKGAWNPTRILPETVGGLIGDIGAFIIYPVLHDYVRSIAVAYGLAFALLVALYFYAFGALLKKCFKLDDLQVVFTSFIFFVLHFQITKVELWGNNYLFEPHGVSLGVYYFMPSLLCAMLAFYLMKKLVVDDFLGSESVGSFKDFPRYFKSLKNGFVFLVLYLCVYSNLLVSGTLMAFLGAGFLFRIVGDIKTRRKRNFKEFVFNYSSYLAVFIMFLLGALIETTGGRADGFDGLSIADSIAIYPATVLSILNGVNKAVVFISAMVIVLALDLSVMPGADRNEGKRFRNMLGLSLMSLIIDFVYVSLLSIRLNGYMASAAVYNGLLVWLVISVGISCGYVVKRVAALTAFMPIVAFVLFFTVLNVPNDVGNGFGLGDRMYGSNEINSFYYEEDTSIVEQFVAADKSGAEEFVVYCKGNMGDYDQWAIYRVRRTLLRHGIIDRVMEVKAEKIED